MAIPFGFIKETATMAKAISKSGVVSKTGTEIFKYMGGVPFNHPSQEYLFTSNVFLLSILIEIYGLKAAGKSTVALWFMENLIMNAGGLGHLIDTEHKLAPAVLWGLIDPERYCKPDQIQFMAHRADTQEGAQTVGIKYLNKLRTDTFGVKANRNVPQMMGMIIDSWRVSAESTQDDVTAEGHAKKRFAFEAASWRDWLTTVIPMMGYLPATLMVVNHLTEKDVGSGIKVKETSGGEALKYHATYRLLCESQKKVDQVNAAYTQLKISTVKNSYGPDKRSVFPHIVYRREDLEPGKIMLDWNPADEMLLVNQVPKSLLTSAEVCNVTASSSKPGLFSDSIMGLKDVPITEIVAALYADAERLAKFRQILGIQRYKTIEELWGDGWFFDARGNAGLRGSGKTKGKGKVADTDGAEDGEGNDE